MQTAQLRAFLAVATHGGFSAGAAALGISQPAVTQHVRALEAAHGVTLFHRRGRRVELSEAGAELLPIARRIFALTEEAERALAERGRLTRGTLRVGADGPYHLMPILSRLRAEHPGLQVAVTVGNSALVEASLLELAVDVAILAEVSPHPALYARRLGRFPVVVFVGKGHPLARGGPVKLAQLDGEPMVVRERGSMTRRAFEAAVAARGVRPEVVLEIESREAMREAVAAGLGFGVISAPELGYDERLVLQPIADADVHTEEHLVCLEERRKSRAIEAFFQVAFPPRRRR